MSKKNLWQLMTGGILLVSGCHKPVEKFPDSALYITEKATTAAEDWNQLEESAKMQKKLHQAEVKVKQIWPMHPADISDSNIPNHIRASGKWYLYRDNEWDIYAISTNKGN